MKLWIFVISLFIIGVRSQQGVKDMEACVAEIGLDKDTNKPLTPGSPESECFRACIMKKKGVIKDGKADLDATFDNFKKTTRLPLQALREKVKVCIEKANEETNKCNVAKVLVHCMNT